MGFLKQKEFKTAMVEWGDSDCVERAKELLEHTVEVFGNRIEIVRSNKQSLTVGRDGESKMKDGTNAFQDFTDGRRNRFSRESNYSNIFPPSRTLHFFNTPDITSDEDIRKVFTDLDAPEPIKILRFPKKEKVGGGRTKGSGCLQFSDDTQATEALVLANHARIKGGEIWLTFTRQREDSDFN